MDLLLSIAHERRTIRNLIDSIYQEHWDRHIGTVETFELATVKGRSTLQELIKHARLEHPSLYDDFFVITTKVSTVLCAKKAITEENVKAWFPHPEDDDELMYELNIHLQNLEQVILDEVEFLLEKAERD